MTHRQRCVLGTGVDGPTRTVADERTQARTHECTHAHHARHIHTQTCTHTRAHACTQVRGHENARARACLYELTSGYVRAQAPTPLSTWPHAQLPACRAARPGEGSGLFLTNAFSLEALRCACRCVSRRHASAPLLAGRGLSMDLADRLADLLAREWDRVRLLPRVPRPGVLPSELTTEIASAAF